MMRSVERRVMYPVAPTAIVLIGNITWTHRQILKSKATSDSEVVQ